MILILDDNDNRVRRFVATDAEGVPHWLGADNLANWVDETCREGDPKAPIDWERDR